MTIADMLDPLTIVWTRTGLVVRRRPDLPGIPVVTAKPTPSVDFA